VKITANWTFEIPLSDYTVEAVKASVSRRERLAFGEVVAAMALAGSTVVAGRVLGSYLPVFGAALASFLFALAVSLPLQLTRLSELATLKGRELLLMGLQALFGMVLFRILVLYGLKLAPAMNAGIVMSAAPTVTLLLARFAFHEALDPRRIVSISLTILGLAVVNLGGLGSGKAAGDPAVGQAALGTLLVLGAVVSESLLTIFRKMSRQRVSSVTNTTVLCLVSSLLTLPLAAAEAAGGAHYTLGVPALAAAAYYGSFATVVAYLLWGDGVLHIPAGRAGIAMGAMPVSSCLFSALFLHEHLGIVEIAGCLLAAAGIVLASKRS